MREDVKRVSKMNDKGFSLIELIIVIAIMAILIGIVGMQFMPYIEKSRQAKDKQVLSGVLTNATSAFATCADTCEVGSTDQQIKITVSNGTYTASTTSITAVAAFDGSGDVINALIELMKGTTKFESKAGKTIAAITITRNSDGKVTVSVATSTGAAIQAFSNDMSSN